MKSANGDGLTAKWQLCSLKLKIYTMIGLQSKTLSFHGNGYLKGGG